MITCNPRACLGSVDVPYVRPWLGQLSSCRSPVSAEEPVSTWRPSFRPKPHCPHTRPRSLCTPISHINRDAFRRVRFVCTL
ncbi:hypothetical protein C8Q74DRAFT_1252326, partial [Fomes fomentarius]